MTRLSDAFLKKDKIQDAKSVYDLMGMKFTVRSSMNKEYAKAVKNGPSEKDYEGDYYNDCVAKHLLVTWENVLDDDKKPIEPTEENRVKILREYTELATRILSYAAIPQNFVGSNFEEELGN